jgi:hypothetical protein
VEKDRKDTSFSRKKTSPCCWLWPTPAARAAVAAYYDARGNEVDRNAGERNTSDALRMTSILKTKAETATDRWCDNGWESGSQPLVMAGLWPGLRKRLRVGNAACVGA